ncbi:pyridoxamine 5'-phosphate oxidase family protein [Streptomyces sp. NRRL S-350]|uniref:pyridoxamine 5'-phosphate oxidase family protein n=1 Tax=Streptomyces sp. NRRL S-350 TaxID=1463902 RepID=UPI000AF4711E|nr:pyridoxamine 5'-phosphate oxidase family protein [Streptomyces sp. NRRL S-350]
MTSRSDASDVTHRVARRRDQLGMSEGALAHRAAMSPAYLRQLLRAGPEFDPPAFVRITTVLGMTWPELLSGRRPDAPPGTAGADPRPRLSHLTEPQCWDLLGTHGIGRIGLPGSSAPLVLPVNYVVDARTIAYRTAPRGAAAPREGSPVSFEVDHIDDHRSRGWSVLILGEARRVGVPEEEERLSALPGATPWADGSRPLWVRVRPDGVSGRRIDTV